jgi:hypothetical protein
MLRASPSLPRSFFQALLIGTAATFGSRAHGWNAEGHMTVAAVAWKDLSLQTRATASALLKLNPDYPNWVRGIPAADADAVAFVRAATWPDQIRSTYEDDGSAPRHLPTDSQNIGYGDCLKHRYWHFYDIPFSTDGSPLVQADEPNALTQIRAFSAALGSPATPDEIKSYDLGWLLHLVGDIHQPLHATSRFTAQSPKGDHGGNSVTLCPHRGHSCSQRFDNLHAFWDDALGNSNSASTALKFACVTAASGSRCLADAPTETLLVTDPATWADESFAMARSVAYQRPIGPGKGPYYVTAAYKAKVGAAAETRVAIAGARLAKLLDQTLAMGVQAPVATPPLADASACPRLP